jgi:ABC-type uncharacterized transport system fused permease/ATPase subunit
MASGTHYRLAMSGELANLDQRIAEDTRAFTATTLMAVAAERRPDGNLDRAQDLGARLSSREQQSLAFVRTLLARPRMAS